VLVTEKEDATRAAFLAYAKARGASDLMSPAEVMVIDKLPVLGSGKADLVTVARLVMGRQQVAAA
jgi:acyl-[acyl-carrier-protein]-phospholipid O-acyltransferase/long-chain-fatty-acid--[acyl-carrier-protein] ligase